MARSQAPRAEAPETAGGLDIGELQDLLGFHIRFAHLAMYRDWAASLKACDLTQKQFAVLSLIRSNPGCSQIALGGALGTDRATMMAVIDRLEDRGLLIRQRSKVDRRRQELSLTTAGEALLVEAGALIARHESRFRSVFTPAELDTLTGWLRRIYEPGPAAQDS